MTEQEFDPLSGMSAAATSNSAKPFGLKERLITTLVFDTQPARKKAWLAKLGYEENPKDDNLIRPVGSTDDEYFPIDPGGMFNFHQYYKDIKEGNVAGGIASGASELGKDLFEGAMDLLQGTVTEGAGRGAGMIAGGATGNPAAAAPAFVTGRSAGRIAAFNAIENMKDKVGDMFLEEDMPIDTALRATQSAIQAVGPEVLAKGGSAAKKALSKSFSAVSSGVRNLLSIGDGKIGEQAWATLKTNPGLLSDEKVLQGASSGIDSTVEKLTGLGDDGMNISRSVFQPKLTELQNVRSSEAEKLSQDPRLSKTVGDMIRFFDQKRLDLSDPSKFPLKSASRQDSIDYINSKISDLKKIVPEGSSASQVPLNFGQMDSMVRELQSDLYGPSLLTKDWRNAVKSIVDGTKESPGLNNTLKSAADSVGSPYSAIKAQQSKIFDAFDSVSSNVTREKAKRFIIGDDLIDPRGNATDTVARDFSEAVGKADAVLGSDFANQLRSGQIQNQFWQALSAKGSRGSGGSVVPALAAGTTVGAGLSKMGIPSDVATLAGTAAGGLTYAATQPKLGTRLAIGAEKAANAIENSGLSGVQGGIASQLGAQEVASELPSMEQTPEQTFDPLGDFDPLKDFGK